MQAPIGATAVLDGLADLAAVRAGCRAQVRTGAAARRYRRINREETQTVIKDEIEALVARERPGWRVVEVVEINDESGPSFEVVIEGGDDRVTVLVSADERIVGERR
jgi:hypothetical protein